MHPQPLFTVFGKGVHLYGICIAVGILVCLLVYYLYTKKLNMSQQVQDFTFFVAIAAIALGFVIAKLYQAVYDYIVNPNKGFDFYGAGITAMGGFIGGAVVFIIIYFVAGKFCFTGKNKDIHKKDFNKVLVTAPCCITVAHAFGRIGCLMAGCCHGERVGDSYTFGTVARYIYDSFSGEVFLDGYYVPVQLYESLFLFVLFAVLSLLLLKKRCNITVQIYLIAYGVWRFILEFFRTDAERGNIFGLYASQWQSIIFVALGIGLIVFYAIKKIPFFIKKEK